MFCTKVLKLQIIQRTNSCHFHHFDTIENDVELVGTVDFTAHYVCVDAFSRTSFVALCKWAAPSTVVETLCNKIN